MEYHNIDPIYNSHSKVLILGSFPSVKSREVQFFYSHPQNRFWKVLSAVLKVPLPTTIQDRKSMLLTNRIALWDVVSSCEVVDSSDSTIKDVVVNDISTILNTSKVEAIYTNGSTAHRLYKKYLLSSTNVQDIPLPSTSSANARWQLQDLISAWNVIINF